MSAMKPPVSVWRWRSRQGTTGRSLDGRASVPPLTRPPPPGSLLVGFHAGIRTGVVFRLIMIEISKEECQTFDVKSSAAELGVCEETVRRLVRRKVLRKLSDLRRVLIPRIEIHRYLSGGNPSRLS
jgi:Helix-turn-helix domain